MACCLMHLLLVLLASSLLFISRAQTMGNQKGTAINSSVPAMYAFGDSAVDSGNNNYVKTYVKCNFPPYGKDFPGHVATGRFSNGKLITDFIASYIGLKDLVPPYLNKSLSIEELISGVSFASGGAGYDPITPLIPSGVIKMTTQINLFKEYKLKLESMLGKEMAENHIQNALFIISAGSTDLGFRHLYFPSIRKIYTVEQYEQFLLDRAQDFLEEIWKLGARRIGVLGTIPIGCLPIVITIRKRVVLKNGCVESDLNVAIDFNEKLRRQLDEMQKKYEELGARISYGDIYTTALDMIYNPQNYGFEKTHVGCCGTGILEFSYLCNPLTPVCADVSKYIYWDSIHVTEKAYSIIFKSILMFVNYLVAP